MNICDEGAIRTRLELAMKKSVLSEEEQRGLVASDLNGASLGHLREQISAEAMLLVQQRMGPGVLMNALVSMGMSGLCAMAAEVHFRVTASRMVEDAGSDLAERSPVFIYKKMVFICPVGALETMALQHITDRALKAVNGHRIKTAILNLSGLSAADATITQWTAMLREELAAIKIALRIS